MNLNVKIFLTFFVLFFILLGSVFFITRQQTEEFEFDKISSDLHAAQHHFEDDLKTRQRFTLKLVKTITLDQKFRSFLSQIKENFYSFMEEIAADTGADVAFMIDDSLKLRGIYPNDDSTAWVQRYLKEFKIESVLDQGQVGYGLVLVKGKLFSVVRVPLKEFLTDDYALGAVVVGHQITDERIRAFAMEGNVASELHLVFYDDEKLVAGSVPSATGNDILKKAKGLGRDMEQIVYQGNRYLIMRQPLDELGESAGLVYFSNLDHALEPFKKMQEKILYVGLIIFAMGGVVLLVFSNRIVKPIKLLLSGTEQVASGNLDIQIEHRSSDEVGELSEAFNHMVKELRDKQLIEESFGKYVHPALVQDILRDPDKLKLGGERRRQTILFSDIADFTRMSDGMDPQRLIVMLNKYLGLMTDILMQYEGVLDKYIGDGIMAFWGPPFTEGDFPVLACRAAIDMQKELDRVRPELVSMGFPELYCRIGLATGTMVVGNIGSEKAQEYTCIGDTVNLSSRLEGVNKVYNTRIIIDNFTQEKVHEEIFCRELDLIQVKGSTKGSQIYEVVDCLSEITLEQKAVRERYESALAVYKAGDFQTAAGQFKDHYDRCGDLPGKVMHERCLYYLNHPPESWDGVHVMTQK